MEHNIIIKIYILTAIITLVSCSDEKENKHNYKKQSNIPATGLSLDKKGSPEKKIGDYY